MSEDNDLEASGSETADPSTLPLDRGLSENAPPSIILGGIAGVDDSVALSNGWFSTVSLDRTALGEAIGDGGSMPSTALDPNDPGGLPEPALPNGKAGRYRILGEIARGGMGAVLWGRDADLNRDLAVKVLLDRHRARPELLRRFYEEAQIGGQLQHPGIVPIYDIGMFSDRRPFFAMKLVRGRTLAVLLKGRESPAADLPRFLAIFDQVAQTIAYAHSKGVIHRDLKPANVMVGAFGEVQVMDWGLAKVLGDAGTTEVERASNPEAIRPVRNGSDGEVSEAGAVMGTPAYMAPEQANGEIARVDERADVFGLGAILCEILTGEPVYLGTRAERIARAKAADLADAMGRLDACGADPELIALARACLAAEPASRLRDASAVASAMTAYLAGVQDRLRASEMARVEAQARARTERLRRRFTVALAAALLLAGLIGGGSWLSFRLAQEARIAAADRLVVAALAGVEALRAEAQREGSDDPDAWPRAVIAADKARDLLAGRPIRARLKARVEAEHARIVRQAGEARERSRRIEAERSLVERLDDARLRGDGVNEVGFDSQAKTAAYARALRDAGIDLDRLRPSEASARLAGRESKDRIAAALDDWARHEPDGPRRKNLLTIARSIDPDGYRNRIRDAIASRDRAALIALAGEAEARKLSATSVVLVAEELAALGAAEEAVTLLSLAATWAPDDFWINQVLGYQLGHLASPRWGDAVRFLSVAVALRPRSPGAWMNLGVALAQQKKLVEAVLSYQRAVELKPDYAAAYLSMGEALIGLGRPVEAVAALRKSLEFRPGEAYAHYNLGYALLALSLRQEAIDAFREVIKLDSKSAEAHYFIGFALAGQGKRDQAIAAYEKSLAMKPGNPEAHHNLGYLLIGKGELDRAIAEIRTAIGLRPDDTHAYINLGVALMLQEKLGPAEEAFRKAVEIDPDSPDARCALAGNLRAQGRFAEALDEFRLGHALGLEQPEWYAPSADWVAHCERLVELGDGLDAMLARRVPPRDNADRMMLGQVCLDRGLFAAACGFWSAALADDPKLADDRIALRRYHAACAAAMAGLGLGKDGAALDETARAGFRRQALAWLREELSVLDKSLVGASAAQRATVVATLRDWKYEPHLFGVRDALTRLPEVDRAEWAALWADVDAVRVRAGVPTP